MITQLGALYRRRRETEPLRAHITRRQSRVQAAVYRCSGQAVDRWRALS